MRLFLLLASALVAVNARASRETCSVSEWSEWSEYKTPQNLKNGVSFNAPDVPAPEDDEGRKQFFKTMKEKQEMAEHRAHCRESGDCPEMQYKVDDGAHLCTNGFINDAIPCLHIDQQDYVSLPGLGLGNGDGNDCWGWTDPAFGTEIAIIGVAGGTSFVDITNPTDVQVLAWLPTATFSSSWRDMKTVGDHVFIVSEASNHGMQVFDLKRLRTERGEVTADAHYTGIPSCHNIIANEASNTVYAVGCAGSNGCNDGLHAIDVSDPTNPTFAGCFSTDGYVHDAQCIIYDGPDADYQGREICFCYNEDTFTIVDATNKGLMRQISRSGYLDAKYTHQGWLTADKRYALMDDEADENNGDEPETKTYIWNVEDLDDPVLVDTYMAAVRSIDHNQYMVGDLTFQANYESGLRVLQFDSANVALTEIAYFDVFPSRDAALFNGAWSVYPYFASGNIPISSINDGLYVVKLADTFPAALAEAKTQTYKQRTRSRQILDAYQPEFCPALVEYDRVAL